MIKGSSHRGEYRTPRVRLEAGSHRTPDDGVCVVELASIIGGERFSDRPDCVCPVIGSFLRGWNDRAGYADRQRLGPYASHIVGTGGYRRISRIRRDRCLEWIGLDLHRGPILRAIGRLRIRARIAWSVGVGSALRLNEGAGAYAARFCFAQGGSDEAFELLDRLLEVGLATPAGTPPTLPARWVPADLERLGATGTNGNGNGNGHGHPTDELAIKATIAARERGKSRRGRSPSPGGRSA
jgi:hypothetical protein